MSWDFTVEPEFQELGGHGYGQLKLAMLNEILGRSIWRPRIFGTQARPRASACSSHGNWA